MDIKMIVFTRQFFWDEKIFEKKKFFTKVVFEKKTKDEKNEAKFRTSSKS